MSTHIPADIQQAADITHITQLILTERESRDTGQWDHMRDCFHPDSIVRISWFNGSGPDFVEGSIDMARRGMLARHRLGPVRVRLNGDRAVATLAAIIDIPMLVEGVDLVLSAHSRFVYRAERRACRWRLFSFEAIYLRDEFTPAILGQTIEIDPEEMQGFRPSYRNLSYSLARTGYEVNSALPGEDRPETVARLMDEVNHWAGF